MGRRRFVITVSARKRVFLPRKIPNRSNIYYFSAANAYPGIMISGMTFTIEPILSIGSPNFSILEDEWTAVTKDNSRTAQFEHSILITSKGCEVLTIADSDE